MWFTIATSTFRAFKLEGLRYRELSLPSAKLWIDEIQIGLGVWQGRYEATEGKWLRWYDSEQNWIPTAQERAQRAEQERRRAELERRRAEQERRRAELEQQRVEQVERELDAERVRTIESRKR